MGRFLAGGPTLLFTRPTGPRADAFWLYRATGSGTGERRLLKLGAEPFAVTAGSG